MAKMQLLDEVKSALRVSTNDAGINSEIKTLVQACVLDLKSAGVKIDLDDDLIKLAIVTFCKARFGFDNPDAEGFSKSYTIIKQHLMNYGEYLDEK